MSLLAFLMGASLWYPANHCCFDEKRELDRAVRKRGDPLELLLTKAMKEAKSVLLTTKSGKVYVGFVSSPMNPAFQLQSLSLAPTVSGFRDADQRVRFTTDYLSVYEKLLQQGDSEELDIDPSDFQIVIPVAELRSVSTFDSTVYRKHFDPAEGS